MRTIKAKGGLTIVQNPATAEFTLIPAAAIGACDVDRILPLDEIPEPIMEAVHMEE